MQEVVTMASIIESEAKTKEDREIVAKNDWWLSGVIDKYYEKYEDEFETRGVERLKIDESKKNKLLGGKKEE